MVNSSIFHTPQALQKLLDNNNNSIVHSKEERKKKRVKRWKSILDGLVNGYTAPSSSANEGNISNDNATTTRRSQHRTSQQARQILEQAITDGNEDPNNMDRDHVRMIMESLYRTEQQQDQQQQLKKRRPRKKKNSKQENKRRKRMLMERAAILSTVSEEVDDDEEEMEYHDNDDEHGDNGNDSDTVFDLLSQHSGYSESSSKFSVHSFSSCTTVGMGNGNLRFKYPYSYNADDYDDYNNEEDDESSVVSTWTAAQRTKFIGLFQDIIESDEEEDYRDEIETVLFDNTGDDEASCTSADSMMTMSTSTTSSTRSNNFLSSIEHSYDTNPWNAAKCADIKSLKAYAATSTAQRNTGKQQSWVIRQDEHQYTPLYYACTEGSVRDPIQGLLCVLFLIDQLKNSEAKSNAIMIPKSILTTCYKDAANSDVKRLLNLVERQRKQQQQLDNDDGNESTSSSPLYGEYLLSD